MFIILEVQSGGMCEIQNKDGETMVAGGKDLKKLFVRFEPMMPDKAAVAFGDHHYQLPDTRRVFFDIPVESSYGVLRTAIEREQALGRAA